MMVRITKEECAYLAGLIDGEGTITINRITNESGRGFRLVPKVIITNTNLEVLQKIKTKFGGSMIKRPCYHDTYKIGYNFVFKTSTLRWLLPKLAPYLQIKWKQAQILKEYLLLTQRIKPFRYNEDKWNRLEELHQEIAELNVRGVE